jgi:hypothetical protein
MPHPFPRGHSTRQSTKLAVYEERLQRIVHSTAHLPEQLALTGKVGITGKQIARLIGQVFLQRSAVNLLSSVMDTPEYFCERRGRGGGVRARSFPAEGGTRTVGFCSRPCPRLVGWAHPFHVPRPSPRHAQGRPLTTCRCCTSACASTWSWRRASRCSTRGSSCCRRAAPRGRRGGGWRRGAPTGSLPPFVCRLVALFRCRLSLVALADCMVIASHLP